VSDDIAEQIRDLAAREHGQVSEGATDYGVLTVVVEEHAGDVDAACIYKTDFRDDADDTTAAAFASALAATAPELLLEMALVSDRGEEIRKEELTDD
jgi:hypothetical protein